MPESVRCLPPQTWLASGPERSLRAAGTQTMWTRWRRHKGQLAQQHAEQQAFQERVEASLAAVVEMLVPERSSKVEQLEERIERLESVAVWSQSPQDLPATSELQVQQLANCSRVQ
eukprot:scaffold85250_cov69-Phaeocystis_antarctica.AAC.1